MRTLAFTLSETESQWRLGAEKWHALICISTRVENRLQDESIEAGRRPNGGLKSSELTVEVWRSDQVVDVF